MDVNILIGGAAGQGMDTVASMLTKVLQRSGYFVYTTSNYRSRVRGGHNFFQIRFSDHRTYSAKRDLDMIFALDHDTLVNHIDRLKDDGIAFSDSSVDDFEGVKKFDLNQTAKDIGNERVVTTLGLGIIMGYFQISYETGIEVIDYTFREDLRDVNYKALEHGYNLMKQDFSQPSKRDSMMLIDGNQAVGLGAVAAGCKFYCGYPMTPSSGVLGYMADASKELDIAVDQVEDEVAALNMALGASFTGVRAMTGSSGGGLALMQEALSLAGIIEQPIVIINVQRPGPATGLPTDTEQADLRFLIHGGHGEFQRIIISLRDHEDAFWQTTRAFNLADKYQVPVILLSDQYLADSQTAIEPFDLSQVEINRYLADPADYEPDTYKRYEITESGISPRLIPGQGHMVMVDSDEHNEFGRIDESQENRIAQVDKRQRKMELFKEDIIEPDEYGVDDYDTLLVGWGSTTQIIREAIDELNEEGYKIKGLGFGDIWPLPLEKFNKFYNEDINYIVIEQNHDGQLEGLIRQEALVKADAKINKYDGRPFYLEELKERIVENIE